ncbi:MAG: thioesterase [Deltaproteobacteria bacterium CG23_combo_of_CG06-09_8_20_14_all_60_8]|nr:MAG: thioesterase [Deltaproteobacteria bacterium CG23_combo_of_CG06-09_8_20_14_all_60_8]
MNAPDAVATCEQTRIRVLYGDTDAGGVVYYAHYLRFFEAGRTEFMRSRVFSYHDLEAQGFILPVVECHARYKASARYDDLLVVHSRLTLMRPVSCRFDYRIERAEGNRLLVLGYTVHAVVDRQGKLSRLPDEVLATMQGFVVANE